MATRELKVFLFGIILIGGGLFAFFHGFFQLRKKRLIENTPTSTIRGLAMGLTELIGKAKQYLSIYSPLTNTACCYYEYTIEKYKRTGKRKEWVIIAKDNSENIPFILEDETGKILVSPKSAEKFFKKENYSYTTGIGRPIPWNILGFMDTLHIRYTGFWNKGKFRFKEWCIIPEQTIYVLGDAQESKDLLGKFKQELDENFDKLLVDPLSTEELDLNKDGKISPDEWVTAKRNIEKKTMETLKEIDNHGGLADVIISKSKQNNTYILSEYSQKGLINKIFWTLFFNIYGGIAISLSGLALTLFVLKGGLK